ncbi:hypothetical protein K6V18_23990 [Ralstonia insidiosa]|uniref:hypothetical protein n=1 Tax=Ralstonia TaxID=48736 RepID=UPI000A4D9339|nr:MULTISPECIES: hypothetical protein [Ralstonia]MBY4708102.1 hypothetical protein [Ralstonia insidiosa]
MHIRFQCRSAVQLQRFVPAFPITITAQQTGHSIRRRGYHWRLAAGRAVSIPELESFDLLLSGDLLQTAGCTIELEDDAAAAAPSADTLAAIAQTPALPLLLSRLVFLQPEAPWNLHSMGCAVGIKPDRLRQLLFARGAALGQICKTQRLMRALFESMQTNIPVARLKRRIGWAESGDLEATFHDWFGVSLQTVARMRGEMQ